MKPGTFAFLLFVAAYVGFEVWAVSKSSYRLERDFIYGQHVGAAYAVRVCSVDKSENEARFERNLAYAKQRAREALLETGAEVAVATALADVESEARAEVDAIVAEKGCDDIEVWKLSRRFDLLARQNPPIADL
ncbi:MAG: hypothetical protein AAFY69_15255 [Pseudomonadota bacterium]